MNQIQKLRIAGLINQQATARRGQDALLLPEKNALTRINKSEKTNIGTLTDTVQISDRARELQKQITEEKSKTSQIQGFTLTKKQQEKYEAILSKYKDAPYNDETFKLIQKDLREAYLAPDQLENLDKVKKFNPTRVLLDALSGKNVQDPNYNKDKETEQNLADLKKNKYMKDVLSDWQKLSTTYSADKKS